MYTKPNSLWNNPLMNCIQSDSSDAFGDVSDMDLDQNDFSEVQLKTSKVLWMVVQNLHPFITTFDIGIVIRYSNLLQSLQCK